MEKNNNNNNHAILVDASRFWFNYRHAANTLAVYKTIKRFGIPDENIILMVADDYACNSRNVRPGEVFTDDSGYENNVYTEDIEVDYRGDEVTPANVLKVLLDAHYDSGATTIVTVYCSIYQTRNDCGRMNTPIFCSISPAMAAMSF